MELVVEVLNLAARLALYNTDCNLGRLLGKMLFMELVAVFLKRSARDALERGIGVRIEVR